MNNLKTNPKAKTEGLCARAYDMRITNHGSIFLLTPLSQAGRRWITKNLPKESMKYGESTVIEHRYAWDIYKGAEQDGMVFA